MLFQDTVKEENTSMKLNEALNKKVKAAFAHNLTPILCCGETLEQRENGTTNEVVGAQIKADLEGLSPELAEKVVIAYEPIWLSEQERLLQMSKQTKQ